MVWLRVLNVRLFLQIINKVSDVEGLIRFCDVVITLIIAG